MLSAFRFPLYKDIPLKKRFVLYAFRFQLFCAFSFVLSAFGFAAQAQTWEAGGSVGAASYMGDLNQRAIFKPSGPGGGLFVQRNLNPYLSLKLNYTYSKIAGADSTSSTQQQRDRNLSFKTTFNELSLVSEFNFMKYTPGAEVDRFTPYIFLGIGAATYKPQADYMGTTYNLRELRTEGQDRPYSNISVVVPYGAGVKYNFSSSWNIMLSAGYRYVFTDYLDDVSGAYAAKSSFTNPVGLALSDRLGERTGVYNGSAGTQRGDYRSRDSYLFVGFTLSFTFVTANCYY